MDRIRLARVLGVVVALLAPHLAFAETPDGLAIMRAVDERPRGRDELLRARWRMISASGSERVRETRSLWRDQRSVEDGLHSKRLIVFDAPATLKDMAFLVWSHEDPEQDDTRWIYLPALRKVRRIAGGDRGNAFAGSDFSYDDLAERALEEDRHVWLREEAIDGVIHHVVESTPLGESPYSKRIQWVDPGSHTIRRVELYDPAGELLKRLDARWRESEGIFAWQRLEMENLKRGQRTIVEVEEFQHDLGLGEELFGESGLRFGGR